MGHLHRLYWADELAAAQTITLSREQSKHLVQVLRYKVGASCYVFNNQGEYAARVCHVSPTRTQLLIEKRVSDAAQTPYEITIAQAIPQTKKLDLVIQKASELGAATLQPLVSARSMAQCNQARSMKLATAAAMQCQRGNPLMIEQPCSLVTWLATAEADLCLLAHHPRLSSVVPMKRMNAMQAKLTASAAGTPKRTKIVWLIGPEGGFDDAELEQIAETGFVGIQLSEYILRTETVALAALAVTDYWWRNSVE